MQKDHKHAATTRSGNRTPAKPAPPERRGRGPGRSLEERVTAAETRLVRLRQNAETQLLRAAEKARVYDYKFTTLQLQTLMQEIVAREPRPLSLLRRSKMELEQLKARKAKSSRKDMGRTKALLGSFMVAQWRHKPDLHGEMAPDLRNHLAAHPRPEMAQANLDFMAGLLADPGWEENAETNPDGFAVGISPQQLRRNQSRRMILIGAWVLERRSDPGGNRHADPRRTGQIPATGPGTGTQYRAAARRPRTVLKVIEERGGASSGLHPMWNRVCRLVARARGPAEPCVDALVCQV